MQHDDTSPLALLGLCRPLEASAELWVHIRACATPPDAFLTFLGGHEGG